MNKQLSFTDIEYGSRRRITRREEFLDKMDRYLPWQQWMETVDLIFSHVNAVKRKQFNGKSAFEMFCFLYSKDIAQAIGIAEIHPKDVMQSPKLLSLSSHS